MAAEPDRWLSEIELVRLTGFKLARKQCAELARRGIAFTEGACGKPLVDAGLYFAAQPKAKKKAEPNWSAIRGKKAG